MNIEQLKAGIEPYRDERELILEFLSDRKSQREFDMKFSTFPTGPFSKNGIAGHALLLGGCTGYGTLPWWIDLLQHMVLAGYVCQTKVGDLQHYQAN